MSNLIDVMGVTFTAKPVDKTSAIIVAVESILVGMGEDPCLLAFYGKRDFCAMLPLDSVNLGALIGKVLELFADEVIVCKTQWFVWR